jgi:hypothetical protein
VSNSLAIATATVTLSQVLRDTIRAEVDGADVTIARPHPATDGTNPESPTVNLYLYQVTHSAAWRNADLPTRSGTGELRQRPVAGLDLHYLLTFYGNQSELEPERLLGTVVRTLHAQPVLSRQLIRDTVDNPSFPFLATSDLADAVELVKFTPIPFSLEELSKLWSVFLQTSYTLSVAYMGMVVLIEGESTPSTRLPVRERNLYALPFRQPVIEKISAENAEGEPVDAIDANVTLIIHGRQLKGEVTKLRLGGTEVAPEPEDISDKKIRLRLSALPAELLRAGIRTVQVVHQLSLGTPPTPHSGTESNAVAFVLHPIITLSQQSTSLGVEITVTTNPVVGKNQRVVLLLNEMNGEQPAAYSFIAAPRSDDTNTILFPVSDLKAANYLGRLQVDGAASMLQAQDGAYVGPKITIP